MATKENEKRKKESGKKNTLTCSVTNLATKENRKKRKTAVVCHFRNRERGTLVGAESRIEFGIRVEFYALWALVFPVGFCWKQLCRQQRLPAIAEES